MLHVYINSLGKSLALNVFVYNNASHMLGNTVDPPSFAILTFVGHSFWSSAQSLGVHNTTFLVELHICGQRTTPCFQKA